MLKFHPLQISEIRPDAEDAVRVALEVPAALRDEYRMRPGQHIVLRSRVNGEELRSTYSLISRPDSPRLEIAPRLHPKAKLAMHLARNARAGDTVEVLPPNGSFGPRESAPKGTFLAFAAGCGITPVFAIVRSLLEADPQNRVQLVYGNRNAGRTMLLEELMALKDRHLGRFAISFVMSGEPQDIELFNGRIDAAKLDELGATLLDPRTAAGIFICGPGTMIDDLTTRLRSLGVDASRIHSEHFRAAAAAGAASPAPVPHVAPTNQPQAEPAKDGMTQVTVVMDGRRRVFPMRREEETILDAAARAGLDLPFSCRAGVCSTCRTRLVRGEVSMDQNFALEEWELEQGYILACQSHAKTDELELNYDER
jgi:ring-1,2-phenylacetyl-CoA epoxidase subunit PaaE